MLILWEPKPVPVEPAKLDELLTKCPIEPYAYYDLWGNRYKIFTEKEYKLVDSIVKLRVLGIKLDFYH